MSDAKGVTLSLKIMINKQKTKVLFAEANSDFADVLLSFLTLPLGKIAKVLEEHYRDKAPTFGSLSTLYKSIENLDYVARTAKVTLLNPRSSFEAEFLNLKLDICDTKPPSYFICNNFWLSPSRCHSIFKYYSAASCDCGGAVNKHVFINRPKADDGGGVFAINTASFIISDDLRIVPNATGFLTTLRKLGIGDTNCAELRNVTFGIDEIIGLLKWSLISDTPLTDLILNNRQKPSSAAKLSETELLLHRIMKKVGGSSKNIILKVMVQKSTNKLLFAQAGADFIDLLISFLIIPLGGVEFLLESNTCLKNVDNLYRSLADDIDDNYLRTPNTKEKLLKPNLAHFYTLEKKFLPLSEESAPALYYHEEEFYDYKRPEFHLAFFNFLKLPGNYVKEPTAYTVTDDLTVTPFSMTSGLRILDRLNIPLCDVDELEVEIGSEEAVRILKASLTSTSALTNGLMNHIFKKQLKQEHLV